MTLFLVTANNHDYDVMEEWTIGLFSSVTKARLAELEFLRWAKRTKVRPAPTTNIINLEIDEVVSYGPET